MSDHGSNAVFPSGEPREEDSRRKLAESSQPLAWQIRDARCPSGRRNGFAENGSFHDQQRFLHEQQVSMSDKSG